MLTEFPPAANYPAGRGPPLTADRRSPRGRGSIPALRTSDMCHSGQIGGCFRARPAVVLAMALTAGPSPDHDDDHGPARAMAPMSRPITVSRGPPAKR